MSHREKDDDYDNIVAQLGPRYRVIVCKDNWQWIIQWHNKHEWRALYFLTSRDGVVRRVTQARFPVPEAISTLPDHFGDVRKLKPPASAPVKGGKHAP